MFGPIPAPAPSRLFEFWIRIVPAPDDRASWVKLIAEADADDHVVFELTNPTGFKNFHPDLPNDYVMYAAVPNHDLANFVGAYISTVSYPYLRAHWIVD